METFVMDEFAYRHLNEWFGHGMAPSHWSTVDLVEFRMWVTQNADSFSASASWSMLAGFFEAERQ